MKDYSKPYVYKVVNKITKQFYVGSQCSGKIIGINYFTSSHNLVFRNDFENNTQNYEIYILAFFEDKRECVRQENYQIRNSLWLCKDLCLNKHCLDPDKHKEIFSMVGTTHTVSEETRKKISVANKGRKGKSHETSEETRKKISLANKGRKGKSLSEEQRKQISETLKNKYKNDIDFRNAHAERCQRAGQTKKGVKQTQERRDLQSKVISKLWENEEYRKHMSDVHKGQKPSQETIEKRKKSLKEAWSRRKQNGLVKLHYYTNGIDDIRSIECPKGWWPGRTKSHRVKK